MWIVAKVKKNNLDLFCSQLKKKLSDIKYYFPKVNIDSGKKKNILINYVFCFHPAFKVKSTVIVNKTTKGLEYFLDTKESDQDDINKFIKLCKEHEDQNGDITNSFFSKVILNQGKFITGPFSNYFFNLIKKDKKKVSVLVGKMSISISNKSKTLYQPVWYKLSYLNFNDSY